MRPHLTETIIKKENLHFAIQIIALSNFSLFSNTVSFLVLTISITAFSILILCFTRYRIQIGAMLTFFVFLFYAIYD